MAKRKTVAKTGGKGKGLTTTKARDLLQQYVGKDSARVVVSEANGISIKGKKFSYQGAEIGDEMTVVILAFLRENRFYPGKYKDGDQRPPGCFAFENTEGELIPHADSPERQANNCAECPHNEWESGDNGVGKACSNRYRLLVIDADFGDGVGPVEYFQDADVAVLNIPPASLKNFEKYLKDLEKKHNLPVFGAITSLYFDDEIATPTVCFEAVDTIDPEDEGDLAVVEALIGRREEEEETLSEPYNVENYEKEAKKPRRASKKAAGKKVATKKKAPVKRARRTRS